LENPGQDVKKPFPEFAHRKHLVRGVPVQKKCLGKEGQIPMGNEENGDGHDAKMDELKVVDLLCNKASRIKIKYAISVQGG
jgi:hypothetical protein